MENEEYCMTSSVVIERGKEDIPELGARIVTRASVVLPTNEKIVGISYHWPGDPFDAAVGENLALARMWKSVAKALKETAYTVMLENIAQHREEVKKAKYMRNAAKFFISEDKREKHNARLQQALSDGQVLYCPNCEEYYGSQYKKAKWVTCPHCGKATKIHEVEVFTKKHRTALEAV